MQASRSFAEAERYVGQSQISLILICIWILVMAYRWKKVDKFCYFGDMLDADGGYGSTLTAGVRSAWKKFCDYLPILIGKGFSLKLKGKVYATCVRSCLMHGSETWPMKVEHELKTNRTEMSMIRWMCGVKLNERKKSEELRELLGLVM